MVINSFAFPYAIIKSVNNIDAIFCVDTQTNITAELLKHGVSYTNTHTHQGGIEVDLVGEEHELRAFFKEFYGYNDGDCEFLFGIWL